MDLNKKMIFSGTEFSLTIFENEVKEGIEKSHDKMSFIIKLIDNLNDKEKLSILKNVGEKLDTENFTKFDKMTLFNIK